MAGNDLVHGTRHLGALLATGNFSVRLVLQPGLALPPGMVETAMRTASAGEHVGEPNEDRRFGFYARGNRTARGRTPDHHRAHGARPECAPATGYNRVVQTSQKNVGTKTYMISRSISDIPLPAGHRHPRRSARSLLD